MEISEQISTILAKFRESEGLALSQWMEQQTPESLRLCITRLESVIDSLIRQGKRDYKDAANSLTTFKDKITVALTARSEYDWRAAAIGDLRQLGAETVRLGQRLQAGGQTLFGQARQRLRGIEPDAVVPQLQRDLEALMQLSFLSDGAEASASAGELSDADRGLLDAITAAAAGCTGSIPACHGAHDDGDKELLANAAGAEASAKPPRGLSMSEGAVPVASAGAGAAELDQSDTIFVDESGAPITTTDASRAEEDAAAASSAAADEPGHSSGGCVSASRASTTLTLLGASRPVDYLSLAGTHPSSLSLTRR